ncbi:MAG TPA: hypothetical protein VF459_11685 [Caulobacteraceae bacterium]
MFSFTPPSETADPPYPNPELSGDRTQLRLRQLNRLIEMDLEYAEVLHARRMVPAETPAPTLDETRAADAAAVMLDKVHRTIRRDIALEAKLADGSLVREMKLKQERAAMAAERQERVRERRLTVSVSMNEALNSPTVCPRADIERLSDDFSDWMDREPDETFADQRPIGAILWRACREHGLPVDLGVWHNEDWATDEMAYSIPGSPYAAWRTTRGPNPPSFGQMLWSEQPRGPPPDPLEPADNQPR